MAAKKKIDQGPGEDSADADYPLELRGFGARLDRELKRKLGDDYTQTEVAKLTRVSQPTVSNLLNDPDRKHFRLGTVLKIAKALDISLDVLLLDKPDPWRLLARRGPERAPIFVQENPPSDNSPPKPRKKNEPLT